MNTKDIPRLQEPMVPFFGLRQQIPDSKGKYFSAHASRENDDGSDKYAIILRDHADDRQHILMLFTTNHLDFDLHFYKVNQLREEDNECGIPKLHLDAESPPRRHEYLQIIDHLRALPNIKISIFSFLLVLISSIINFVMLAATLALKV